VSGGEGVLSINDGGSDMDLSDEDTEALRLIANGDYSASWIARDILEYADVDHAEPTQTERPEPNTENEERSVFAH